MGRDWLDLPGKSLMASLVWEGSGGFGDVLLVSLSMRAAIVAAGGEGPDFKWPNDLVYGARKVGGILSESCSEGGRRYIIVGIGLNVGYLPGELDINTRIPPTSLLIAAMSSTPMTCRTPAVSRFRGSKPWWCFKRMDLSSSDDGYSTLTLNRKRSSWASGNG